MHAGVALVVPAYREDRLQAFLEAWTPVRFWERLIVVWDQPHAITVPDALCYAHADITDDLGKDAWIISRRDSAIRSYGFLRAYQLGYDVIMTLDDDCYPVPDVLHRNEHLAALVATPTWASSVPGMRVRGLPYGDLGRLSRVMLNVGLWRGFADLDAPTSLVDGVSHDFVPPDGSRVLPAGQYVPLCGMNLAFRREFTPLSYFGLQGEGWPYRRMDDIWAGVVAKKICDHLGWQITLGTPHIQHDRASDPFENLVKEAPGIAMNERFWRIIDPLVLTRTTATGCMIEVGTALQATSDDYLKTLGKAMVIWAGFFEEN